MAKINPDKMYLVKYFNYDKEVIEAKDLKTAEKEAHANAATKKTIVFSVKEYNDKK
jgi:Na+-translocating ferredoxin:NAD+ oxidoreductase RnfC subunit